MADKMTHVIPVYKFTKETPLACIQRIKQAFSYYADVPMTYAGRLDPMADGLLILLAGEECKKKDEYLQLEKVYTVDILLGIGTDTHDLLGMVTDQKQVADSWEDKFDDILARFIGVQEQQYPAYSSKPVNGKPLFTYAKEGKLDDIDIPHHTVQIFTLHKEYVSKVDTINVKNKAIAAAKSIDGDFRQDDIIKSWQSVSADTRPFIRLKVEASTGTYMRQLAYDIGKKLGYPAIAMDIHRSKVGDFVLKY